jgi:hypothetical protein
MPDALTTAFVPRRVRSCSQLDDHVEWYDVRRTPAEAATQGHGAESRPRTVLSCHDALAALASFLR